MTPSDDLSPPRRPLFFPVVIATVFLTIIAGTVGFMLGQRHRNNSEPQRATTSPVSGQSSEPSAAPSGPACPDEAIEFAADNALPTDLTQVFKVVTTAGTTVWICQDGDGALYYQSKRGGVDAPLVQGRNALFLAGVSRVGTDDYQVIATVDGNKFEVTRKRLVVVFANGKPDLVETVKTVG